MYRRSESLRIDEDCPLALDWASIVEESDRFFLSVNKSINAMPEFTANRFNFTLERKIDSRSQGWIMKGSSLLLDFDCQDQNFLFWLK